MNLERLKQISQNNALAQMPEWIEVNTYLTKQLNSDKLFNTYAREIAKKQQKNSVGMIDLFQMLKVFISYSDKDEDYMKTVKVEKEETKDVEEIEKKQDEIIKENYAEIDKEDKPELQVPNIVSDKPKRKRRTKAEIEASKQVEASNIVNEVVEEVKEDIPQVEPITPPLQSPIKYDKLF